MDTYGINETNLYESFWVKALTDDRLKREGVEGVHVTQVARGPIGVVSAVRGLYGDSQAGMGEYDITSPKIVIPYEK